MVGVRRLFVSLLVHPKAGTRRVLRELAAMGDLGSGADGEAVSDTAVVAATRRAAELRAMWAKLYLGGYCEVEVGVETAAADAAVSE